MACNNNNMPVKRRCRDMSYVCCYCCMPSLLYLQHLLRFLALSSSVFHLFSLCKHHTYTDGLQPHSLFIRWIPPLSTAHENASFLFSCFFFLFSLLFLQEQIQTVSWLAHKIQISFVIHYMRLVLSVINGRARLKVAFNK